MLHFPTWKIVLVLFVCFLSVFFNIPNLVSQETLDKYSFLPQRKVNLGLDLRGGSYLLLEVDFDSYLHDQLDNIRNEIRNGFRGKTVDGKKIQYQGGINLVGNTITLTVDDPSISDGVVSLIREVSRELSVSNDDGKISITYDDLALKSMRKNLMEQSIEIVRRRVDETGTREPDIQRQGDNRILLQVPGLDNPDHLKSLLGKTAKLTFHLLDETMPYPDTGHGPVAPTSLRLKEDKSETFYVIKKKVMITGDTLVDARPSFNQSGQPVVNIRFNNLGAQKFGEITKANVGKPFAIVLDGKVITAPVIRGVILGGSAEISGRFTTEEANDMSILLRAGALPAPLNIVEERTVGPSLGADSIAAGKNAMALGTLFVMGFMLFSYFFFGMIANVALVVNIVMVMAVISLFSATLTLPGIAGLVLTMGMAVDANILIFERIREELRNGKTPFAAVDQGFRQAFATIFDSHITTLSASFIMYAFGSGPIRGFAVTLSVGIICSLFTAVLLTRLIVVTWLKRKRPTTIFI